MAYESPAGETASEAPASPVTPMGPEEEKLRTRDRDAEREDIREDAPEPDDPRKPDSPTDIKKPGWKFVLGNAFRMFLKNELIDAAAALTFFTVLSLFPAVIALVSILGLFGQSGELVRNLFTDLQKQGAIPVNAMEFIEPVMDSILATPAPGLGLLVGLVIALWTASNYVKAFGRALNKVYGVPEGRSLIKLYAQQYALTAVLLLFVALLLVLLTLSGPVVQAVGNVFGLGDFAVAVFRILRYPLLFFIVMGFIAVLYWGTPNVKQPKFRWLSPGSFIAILGSILASAAFMFYVSNFGAYNRTYGTLAGVIVFLFWVYLVNIVLMFGAEIDAELERSRELQAGMPAEKHLQLPLRDDKAAIKRQEVEAKAHARARALRRSRGETLKPSKKD